MRSFSMSENTRRTGTFSPTVMPLKKPRSVCRIHFRAAERLRPASSFQVPSLNLKARLPAVAAAEVDCSVLGSVAEPRPVAPEVKSGP
jgi:hypothetical protein